MSDQPPPYGQPQQPPGPPQGQPWSPGGQPPPYGGGGPQPYPSAPYGSPYPPYGGPQKSHTTRNVLLIVGLVVVLLCGGGITLAAVGIKHGVDSVANAGNYAGNPDRPITVKEGDAFTIGPFSYQQGWTLDVAKSDFEDAIDGLTAENTGDSSDTSSIDVKFLKGTTVVGQVDCSMGSADLGPGQSTAMDCSNFNSSPITGYDTITVSDSYKHYSY